MNRFCNFMLLALLFASPSFAPSAFGWQDADTGSAANADDSAQDTSNETAPADDGASDDSDEQKADGLDVWIDKKFDPIASAWEGLVLTSIPVGSKTPDVESLVDATKLSELGLSLSEEKKTKIENLLIERDAAIAAEKIGGEKSKIEANYNEQILALLNADEASQFTELRKVPFVLLLLIGGAAFFTVAFGFINLRLVPFAIKVVSGKFDKLEKSGAADVKPNVNEVEGDVVDTIRDEGEKGEVSHFQALATAVSGTVGLGNISGVAVAIAVGGPGAT
ncbi:MAG: alanine:cation symporter family protein, partial [Planctomycetota bacterium]